MGLWVLAWWQGQVAQQPAPATAEQEVPTPVPKEPTVLSFMHHAIIIKLENYS
jgi:hypothetical protein